MFVQCAADFVSTFVNSVKRAVASSVVVKAQVQSVLLLSTFPESLTFQKLLKNSTNVLINLWISLLVHLRLREILLQNFLMATIPQIRMTRKIAGEYTLSHTQEHQYFEDSIGMVSNWRRRGPVYEVPFRTLYSKAVKNLIVAGRCTSVNETLWDVMRVIPCCAVTGEAAGTAAAMTDDFTTLDVKALQKALKARGVVLHEKDLPEQTNG